jgi:branched-chain amino acid transport system substrate-binding protein
MTTMTRRRFFAATAASALGPFVITRPGWAQTGPIKIGALEPQSGPVKYVGDNDIAALRFAIERLNAAGGALGRKFELVVADSEMKADVSTRRANELILGEKVDFLTGLGSVVGKAAAAVAAQHRRIFFSANTEAAELTGAEFYDTTFRCTLNTDMHGGQLATYFARQKHSRFFLLNPDYNFGREAAAGFKRRFAKVKAPNQVIVGEDYHPFQKVQDFAPYLTKVIGSGAEVLITSNWAQDLRLILQQGQALGWQIKIGNFFLNDPPLLRAVGKAAVGHVTAADYLLTADTPENREFIRQWRERYPEAPVSYRFPDLNMGKNYWAVMWLGDIVRKAGSVEADRVIKAWEGARFRTAWGEVEMRACDHQMLTPGYVAEVQEPEQIPGEIRYYGSEFPYIGRAIMISKDDITVPAVDSGNKRCA